MIKAYTALPFLNDPKRIAEDERLQEIRRASHTRSRLTEEERLIAEGLKYEEIARMNLQLTYQENVPEERIELELARLADGLAMQGRYEEATRAHPVKAKQEHYQMIAEAIARPDDEECQCGPQKGQLQGREIEVPNDRTAAMIYSHKHGGLVALNICTCGHANARPLTGRAANIRQVQAAANKAGKALQNDLEIFAVK